jgi:hypothetical protein
VALYTKRWDHELFYRELKHYLRTSEVLQSHTLETAAQEIAALMLAAALLAQERDRAAAGKVPVLRVSFIKLLELMQPLWLVFALGDDLLEDWQKQPLTEHFYAQARRCLTPKRRRRSCPRAVRQTREQLAAPAQKHLITRTRHHRRHSTMNIRKALTLVPFARMCGQRQLFLSTGDNFFPADQVNF